MITRDDIRALCAAHDALMSEHREETARRDAASSLPVRKTGPAGILYRTGPENAQPPAAATDAAPFIEDGGTAEPTFFGDERDELLARGIGFALSEIRHQLRREFRKQIAQLKKETKALRQQVDAHTENAVEVYCSNVERRLATLEAENIKLKAMLDNRGKRR